MKVAVLGATGRTGSLVVDQLLQRGHDVVAVSRTALPRAVGDTAAAARCVSAIGDPSDARFLAGALSGCDAVVSCIGQNRQRLLGASSSPPDILQRVARATLQAIAALPSARQPRFVYLSAFGVGDDLRRHAWFFRLVLRLFPIGEAYRDHDAAERAICASGAVWSIVRAPGLTEAERDVPLVEKNSRWTSFDTVSRRSLAAFLVACVEEKRHLNETVTIGEP